MDKAIPRLVDAGIDGQSCCDGNHSRLAQGLPIVRLDQIDMGGGGGGGGVETAERMDS